MSLISRDKFREAAAAPRSTKVVTLNFPPALVGEVTVRAMSAKELSLFNEGLFEGNGKKRKVVTTNIQAKMAVRCIVDENGTRLFTDDDADWLGDISADAVGKIFTAIQKLSGLSDDEDDDSGK